MNIGANIREVFGKSEKKNPQGFIKALLLLMTGGLTYVAAPTAGKVQGTPGALLGLGSSITLGILTGQPMIALGGTLTFLIHGAYVFINPKIFAGTGYAFFGWTEEGYTTPSTAAALPTSATTPQVNDRTVKRIKLANGDIVEGYEGQDLKDMAVVGQGRTKLIEGPAGRKLDDKATVGAKRAPIKLSF